MTQRHTQRDHAGRFAPAPAPEADTSVVNVSGDPRGEHGQPVGTVYPQPVHDPRYGRVGHLIPHPRARVIDAQTGDTVSDYAPDVRAILTRPGGRTTSHVVEFDGEPFPGDALPEDTLSGYRRTPGTGYRLPAKGQTDAPPVPSGRPELDDGRGLFR